MRTTLRKRVGQAEQQFLLAVARGEEALEEFYPEWSQLTNDIEDAKVKGEVDDETALLISRVSRAIEAIADFMLQSQAMVEDAQSCLLNDLIQDSPAGDPLRAPSQMVPVASCNLLFSRTSSELHHALGRHEALDRCAYTWLIRNIHDPYPTSTQIRTLGDVSQTSVAQVETWFEEARDAVKWTDLSRKFFASSPTATVTAAKRALLDRDDDVPFDIMFAFTTVKAFAETLFSLHPRANHVSAEQFKPLELANSEQDSPLVAFGESGLGSEGVFISPQGSTAFFDDFSDLSESDESEEDTTPPPPLAGRKRCLDEDVSVVERIGHDRPQKRPRTQPVKGHSAPTGTTLTPRPAADPVSCQAVPMPTHPALLHLMPSELLNQHNQLTPPGCKRRWELLEEHIPEGADNAIDPRVSPRATQKRRLSDQVSIVPMGLCSGLPVNLDQSNGSSPPLLDPTAHSLGNSDFDLPIGHIPIPTVQFPANFDSVDFSIFDWSTLPTSSLQAMTPTPEPAPIYIPSSDLSNWKSVVPEAAVSDDVRNAPIRFEGPSSTPGSLGVYIPCHNYQH
ncbi:hypothetical protein BC834DRAFT_307178 [Gloeopeniophorella convolvens]|nr:hypothetical protein BC834DRAFT_307178 [Gloeopeniophorella convolvens]